MSEYSDQRFALGVLLCMVGSVAQADSKFLPEEEEKIKEIISSRLKVSEQDLKVILAAIRQVAMEEIDFDNFVRQANKGLSEEAKLRIISDLFRIAWADNELARSEIEVIRKIAGLLAIPDSDLVQIEARIRKGKN
ncbi:MAG: TerB family tellurite resistance protein [Candidatus Omnitrophica bacterium]|nr:TerB family tellurite resistance protein [Candidatus Omnitrophota bacterium]